MFTALLLASTAVTAAPRQTTLMFHVRQPDAMTATMTFPVSESFALGLFFEEKDGSRGLVPRREASRAGYLMAGAQLDWHLGDKAMAKADGWLLANAVAYGAGGSYEGSQRFLWVSSAFTYQWVWDNGFSLQTGVGLQGLVWERPAAPGSFGPVAPTAGIAFGVVR